MATDEVKEVREADQLDQSFRKMNYHLLRMNRADQLALFIKMDALPATLVNEHIPQEFVIAVMDWCLHHNKARELFESVVPADQITPLAYAPKVQQ